MYQTEKKFILASSSPRRRAFLGDLGISFIVETASIDETPLITEPPLVYVARMAKEKCLAVMKRRENFWVLAADTIVFLDSEILGKPTDSDDAVSTLMKLCGKVHVVATSYCLAGQNQPVVHQETVTTLVEFSAFSQETAEAYVETGESMDKAGSYGIQGLGGSLVTGITGSYSNVVGLPLAEVLVVLNKYGIVKTK